jgi:hypothetical protein
VKERKKERKKNLLSKISTESSKAFDKSLPRKSCKKKKASQRGERDRESEEKRSVFEGKWRRNPKG